MGFESLKMSRRHGFYSKSGVGWWMYREFLCEWIMTVFNGMRLLCILELEFAGEEVMRGDHYITTGDTCI